MSEILLYYKRPDPTTWVYLSSFLTIGLFFVFHRFWSIRNLDIVLLILLAPGLLVVHEGYRRELIENESKAKIEAARRVAEANRLISMPVTQTESGSSGENGAEPGTAPQADSGSPADATPPKDSVVDADPSTADPPNPADDSAADDTGTEDQATEVPRTEDPQTEDPAQTSGDDSVQTGSESAESADEPLPPVDLEAVLKSSQEQTTNPPPSPYSATEIQRWGFIYLFVVQSFILLRAMLDPLMVRRPLLDPNLTIGGLNFIGSSLFIFMMANVVTSSPEHQKTQGPELGPGYAMMNMLPRIPTRPVSDSPGGVPQLSSSELTESEALRARVAKALAIVAHLAIVSAIVLISNRHFSNLRAGVGCATLYLMLPYTAQMTGRVDHALPAALLLWAVLCYRKPMFAGFFLGLAGGLVYYPLFLLPLWFSFYWQRGARSFAIGVFAALVILTLSLLFDTTVPMAEHLIQMYGLLNPYREEYELQGLWSLGWNPVWRLPVIVAFVILSVFFAIWPAQKNLGTLISGSAAIMVAAQFWHGSSGGMYIAWFLPLLLLTIFRPNLQDRVATKVVIGPPTPIRGSRAELEAV